MKIEDFTKAIKISKYPLNRSVMVVASIEFHSSLVYDENDPPPNDYLVKHLTELLLRYVYDYDQQELYHAFQELAMAAPYDFEKQEEARENLLIAARKQPPCPPTQSTPGSKSTD
jgi:hypothetical protein